MLGLRECHRHTSAPTCAGGGGPPRGSEADREEVKAVRVPAAGSEGTLACEAVTSQSSPRETDWKWHNILSLVASPQHIGSCLLFF